MAESARFVTRRFPQTFAVRAAGSIYDACSIECTPSDSLRATDFVVWGPRLLIRSPNTQRSSLRYAGQLESDLGRGTWTFRWASAWLSGAQKCVWLQLPRRARW